MKKWISLLLGILCLVLMGCGQEELDQNNLYYVYYLNNSETKVEQLDYLLELPELDYTGKSDKECEQMVTEEKVNQLLKGLSSATTKFEHKAPLSMGFTILDSKVEQGKVQLNVSSEYKNMSVTTEVLVRAAIVRTLTQLPEINFVSILVEGSQLLDSGENIVGWMSRDSFIENEGNEINNYQEVKIKLYFANESGDGLIMASRTKEYNTNISLEKLVVEELIKGPSLEGLYPTINPATKVASVTTKDGVCYVNLDENFLTQTYNVSADVAVYSITNSLVELQNVNKVQIYINGDNSGVYREKYNFSTYFERNLDIVINRE